jgi:hypothetical protein
MFNCIINQSFSIDTHETFKENASALKITSIVLPHDLFIRQLPAREITSNDKQLHELSFQLFCEKFHQFELFRWFFVYKKVLGISKIDWKFFENSTQNRLRG